MIHRTKERKENQGNIHKQNKKLSRNTRKQNTIKHAWKTNLVARRFRVRLSSNTRKQNTIKHARKTNLVACISLSLRRFGVRPVVVQGVRRGRRGQRRAARLRGGAARRRRLGGVGAP
uniref:Uncharacterized protein n=1 Tax=Heliothis virescens TaxID=7102 RepID=A0A2A4J544_HELVI